MTTIVEHTPGPWHADTHKIHGQTFHAVFCKARNPDGVFIGTVGTQPESEANASLIAAAPELLAALELIDIDSLPDDVQIYARTAIAKATGAK